MPTSPPLIDLVMRLRQETGRSTTFEDRERLNEKISRLSAPEVSAERKAVQRMLDIATGTAAPTVVHRNRP